MSSEVCASDVKRTSKRLVACRRLVTRQFCGKFGVKRYKIVDVILDVEKFSLFMFDSKANPLGAWKASNYEGIGAERGVWCFKQAAPLLR